MRWWYYCVICNTSLMAWALWKPSWKTSTGTLSFSCFLPDPLCQVLTSSRVGLLLWHGVPLQHHTEEKRGSVSIFWCVCVSWCIFAVRLLRTMEQFWPSSRFKLFINWEEGDIYKAWNLKAILQKLKSCASFHKYVFSFFSLYLF